MLLGLTSCRIHARLHLGDGLPLYTTQRDVPLHLGFLAFNCPYGSGGIATFCELYRVILEVENSGRRRRLALSHVRRRCNAPLNLVTQRCHRLHMLLTLTDHGVKWVGEDAARAAVQAVDVLEAPGLPQVVLHEAYVALVVELAPDGDRLRRKATV